MIVMEKIIATVKDAPVKAGTRVLMRVDYNVPVDAQGQIIDDKRIVDNLPTVKYCLAKRAKVVLCSHFGRPDGQPDPQYSLRVVYERLQKLLPDVTVQFATATVGDAVAQQVADLPNGAVLLLENTRFNAGETKNDPDFAQALAALGDVFVNDAFGAAHRAHASTVGVADYLPAYAGLLMANEIKQLTKVIAQPARPFTVIVGGKKVSDKLPLVLKLLDRADYVLVGGKIAQEWPAVVGQHRAELHVASDTGLDISPATIAHWQPILQRSRTIFWNGPLGHFEDPATAVGTKAVAEIVADCDAFTVVGGGDTAAAVKGYQFDHTSTGGGAALEFVQGLTLPGIACLQKQEEA